MRGLQRKRLRELAKHLRRSRTFDMENYCGTSCCIAGKAVLLYGDDEEVKAFRYAITHGEDANTYWDGPSGTFKEMRGQSVASVAQRVLGLTPIQADILFLGHFTTNDLDAITKKEAAAACEELAKTGDIQSAYRTYA
jgi:hypothetical protein